MRSMKYDAALYMKAVFKKHGVTNGGV
jgi:hypothetical protein